MNDDTTGDGLNLPHDPDAERAVLGLVLCGTLHGVEPFRDISGRLTADDFYRHRHRRVFRAMRHLFRDGQPITQGTVRLALGDAFDDVGGDLYLSEIAAAPALTPELPRYIEQLRTLAELRRLQAACHTTKDRIDGSNRGNAAAVLESARVALRRATIAAADDDDLPTLDRAVGSFLDRQRVAADVVDDAAIPWPGGAIGDDDRGRPLAAEALLPPANGYRGDRWARLARRAGSLRADRLAVLVGGTGRGKSGFALQIAEEAARAGRPTLYLSAEMGTDELVARLLALRAEGETPTENDGREVADSTPNGVPYASILRGRAALVDLDAACLRMMGDCPGLYLWAPSSRQRTAEHLETMVWRIVHAHAGRAPLVVIDYLQRMAEGEDLRRAVRDISAKLRDISRPDGLGRGWPGAAVLALSSTSRSNYQAFDTVENLRKVYGGTPLGSGAGAKAYDLEGMGKESGELETDASLLLLLTTDRDAAAPGPAARSDSPRQALVAVVKNRHGSRGLVDFLFYPACGRFVERSERDAGAHADAGGPPLR